MRHSTNHNEWCTRSYKHYTPAQERIIEREMRSARNPQRKVQALAKRFRRTPAAINMKYNRLVNNYR